MRSVPDCLAAGAGHVPFFLDGGKGFAVVVNSADTSVFQTEAAGSMPADRSDGPRPGVRRGRCDCG